MKPKYTMLRYMYFDDPVYRTVWKNMNARCSYKRHESYNSYGGKGIKVYKPWRTGQKQAFYKFCLYLYENRFSTERRLGLKPPGKEREWQFSRINDTGNYEPGNVEWDHQKPLAIR